jgi:hypothetical protein
MIKKTVFLLCMVLVCFGIASPCFGEQKLLAMPVTEPPVIDGLAGDPAWENAQEIITLDKSSKMPITIKAVYTDTEFFVQVSFPTKMNREHTKAGSGIKAVKFTLLGMTGKISSYSNGIWILTPLI